MWCDTRYVTEPCPSVRQRRASVLCWRCGSSVPAAVSSQLQSSTSDLFSRYSSTMCHSCFVILLFIAHSAKLPTGLCILLALISSFFIYLFNDFLETNYLRIRFTYFRTEWKHFGCRWSIWTSFLISQGTLLWQPILWQNYLPPQHLSLCHSETVWDIALRIRPLIAPPIAL